MAVAAVDGTSGIEQLPRSQPELLLTPRARLLLMARLAGQVLAVLLVHLASSIMSGDDCSRTDLAPVLHLAVPRAVTDHLAAGAALQAALWGRAPAVQRAVFTDGHDLGLAALRLPYYKETVITDHTLRQVQA